MIAARLRPTLLDVISKRIVYLVSDEARDVRIASATRTTHRILIEVVISELMDVASITSGFGSSLAWVKRDAAASCEGLKVRVIDIRVNTARVGCVKIDFDSNFA